MADRKPCVQCGRKIDAYARICPFCNRDQSASAPAAFTMPATTSYAPPRERSWLKPVLTGAGMLLVVLLLAIAARMRLKSHTISPTQEQTASVAPQVVTKPAPRADVTLVPDNGPIPGSDQPITSAPATGTAQGLASQYDRTDATAASSAEYAQIAQRANAEKKQLNATVDPRSIAGNPYGDQPAPSAAAQSQRAGPTLAQARPRVVAPAPVPVTRTAPVPQSQPIPGNIRVRGSATARLALMIGPDGRVTDIEVRQPLPGAETAKLIAAVQRWRFKPGTANGVPVAAPFTVDIAFHE